jgi:LmbE family N-acetylglucosaminyl deacetylase
MKKNVLVVAPHPDDETLGCGGTLLRLASEGHSIHWLIMTGMQAQQGFTQARIAARELEIELVQKAYSFADVYRIEMPTTLLDSVPIRDLVGAVSKTIEKCQAHTVFVPYRNDVHSDHRVTFDATIASCKTFRHPTVRAVYVYETLSETEFGLRPDDPGFRPNLFIDVSTWLEQKIEILKLFSGEIGQFPFPRSIECVRAQALLRGSQSGTLAAEAFMILKEIH